MYYYIYIMVKYVKEIHHSNTCRRYPKQSFTPCKVMHRFNEKFRSTSIKHGIAACFICLFIDSASGYPGELNCLPLRCFRVGMDVGLHHKYSQS